MERCMIRIIMIVPADWAGFSGRAAAGTTGVGAAADIGETGIELIAVVRKRIDRTAIETGALHTAGAGALNIFHRKIKTFIKQQGCAKSMPEAEARVNGQSDGGSGQCACPDRPLSERKKRRPGKRIGGFDTKPICNFADGFLCPSIQGQSRFFSSCFSEDWPYRRSDIAHKSDHLGLDLQIRQHRLISWNREMPKDIQAVSLKC